MHRPRISLLLAASAILVVGTALWMWSQGASARAAVPDAGIEEAGRADRSAKPAHPQFHPTRKITKGGGVVKALVISVVDEFGVGIEETAIARLVSDEEIQLGATDASGEFVLEGRSRSKGSRGVEEILARHASYGPAVGEVGVGEDRLSIVLDSLGSISGRVLLADGGAPQAGVRVLASPRGAHLSCESVYGDPPPLYSDTDSTGFFTVSALERSTQYRITAVGNGYIMVEPGNHQINLEGPRLFDPGTTNVEITVAPLYGVRLIILDEDGALLRSGEHVYSAASMLAKCMDSEARIKFDSVNEVALAGVQGIGCLDEENLAEHVLLYSGRQEKESIGPIHVSLNRPGYKGVVRSVRAPRLRDQISTTVIALQRTTEGWGTVEIDFRGYDGYLEDKAQIHLAGGGRDKLYLLEVPFSCQPVVVEGVPAGEYQVSAQMFGGLFRYPSSSAAARTVQLVVVPNETTRFEIDLGGQQELVCTLRDSAGIPIRGPLALRFLDHGDRSMRIVSFGGPPYTVVGIQTGTYTISAVFGTGVRVGEESYRTQVTIAEGEHKAAVVLRENEQSK